MCAAHFVLSVPYSPKICVVNYILKRTWSDNMRSCDPYDWEGDMEYIWLLGGKLFRVSRWLFGTDLYTSLIQFIIVFRAPLLPMWHDSVDNFFSRLKNHKWRCELLLKSEQIYLFPLWRCVIRKPKARFVPKYGWCPNNCHIWLQVNVGPNEMLTREASSETNWSYTLWVSYWIDD